MSAPSPDLQRQYMQRAIRLAMNGRGAVEPNPMVGCLLVNRGEIIGQGWHERIGDPHAEPNALADCRRRGQSPAGADVYVTLEPCCHLNKRTPPCAPRLIEANVRRVVVGCLDPNPAVNGGGLRMLQSAGVETAVSSLEAEAKQLIAPFLARVRFGRPYVTLKWAESADGKVAGAGGAPVRITNPAAAHAVHALRARSDAIAIGIGTLLKDDPLLTARGVPTPKPLIRVLLDRDLAVPFDCQLVQTAGEGQVIVYCSETAFQAKPGSVVELGRSGVEVAALPLLAGRLSIPSWLLDLGSRDVTHLLVEPGPRLAAGFLKGGWADRIWRLRAPHSILETDAPSAPIVSYPPTAEAALDGDWLVEYLNPRGDLYFAPAPSADFILTTSGGR